MKAPQGTRKNHTNTGTGGTHGMAAQHDMTRLPDPEDISGGMAPAVDQAILAAHQNRGGADTHGLAAQHQTTRLQDAPDIGADIMDAGE